MAGIYIHVPFCASRCIYCGFYTTTTLSSQDRLVRALCAELDMRRDYLLDKAAPTSPIMIDTIYLGGGTPSQLSKENLLRLFDAIYNKVEQVPTFHISPTPEVTMECNPDDLTPQFVQTIARLPVNRVSMGVQTFSDERLNFLRRRHKATDIEPAIQRLRQVGIGNISIDLIFGFPKQTVNEWATDLQKAIELDVEHISAYSLMYEEGTPLFRLLEQQRVSEIADSQSLDMFNLLVDTLTTNHYEHYEISNFAREGFRSRHNASYWQGIPYLGLGPSAHSYDGNSRQWNVSNLRKYMDAIENGTVPMEKETLDEDTKYNDWITTALRTKEGLDLNLLSEVHREYLLRAAEPHLREGNLVLTNNTIALSRAGIFISDSVMSDLVKV
ncbi:radical SAM family heme chaperone HemW [Hoylesella loescheii]|uniref:radical SAM family heme chaperone HemW n=1 Tax=Hoylesella loescheii TaxID=840 RepID=UPI00248EAA60|nr:radical SAM family heme chaperone HemW [Hoylesella loescheii]